MEQRTFNQSNPSIVVELCIGSGNEKLKFVTKLL